MSGEAQISNRRAVVTAVSVLVGLHLAILGSGVWLRSVVLSTWQKGPLVDPAAPYAPENALLLFPTAVCVALDVYLLVLALGFRRAGRTWWLPLVALVASCSASEGALRAWSAQAMTTWFRPHPTLHWVVRSNLADYEHGTGNTPVTTNQDGFRGGPASRDKPEGETRILVLGDSSNFGQGVSGSEMWEHQLQEILTPRFAASGAGTVRVINAACPGWTTYQGLELMRGVAAAYEPDLVLAGFNNDPGPEVMTDAERAGARAFLSPVSAVLFQSEVWLITREAVLATLRRFSPAAQATYAKREAGAKPTYGKLGDNRTAQLVRRVPKTDFLDNLSALQALGEAEGWDTVWINMPVNRLEPDFVDRYVDWDYRSETFGHADEIALPIIDVDGRWVRSRESGLHIKGHVFHPNAAGHRRLAEQVASELLARDLLPGVQGDVPIDGPPVASAEATLRFGWSSLTPVHAHVGVVLEAKPELAAELGLTVEAESFRRGGPQGKAVADGELDAFFSCEVPALHMLASRPDARIVGSPGVLGRIAVVGRSGSSLAGLRGKRVGVAAGSTPALDWQRWGAGLGATTVDVPTDRLWDALETGDVDAVVGWDPWVEQWLRDGDGALVVLKERAFHSVLAVGTQWALTDETGQRPTGDAAAPRAARLRDLVRRALQVAAEDRETWDQRVAERSGWPVEVVTAVADQNALLRGDPDASLDPGPAVQRGLDQAARSLGRGSAGALFGPDLLRGLPPRTEAPGREGVHPRPGGPPDHGPGSARPKGPPGPPPPGSPSGPHPARPGGAR